MKKVEAVVRPHLLDAVKTALQEVGIVGMTVEALTHQRGPHLAFDRDVAAGLDQVEHAALEDVGPGADQVRVDLLGRRLLEEPLDAVI